MNMKQPRVRSRRHLQFVREKACCACNLQSGVQAHHLTHAWPKARGLKSPDSLTVPLCHMCHLNLHMNGKERVWWEEREIDPVEIARLLWEEGPGVAGE